MFAPDDPLKPPGKVFDEPWQAQVLALADSMVAAGHFTATAWAETLGAELARAAAAGRPDTLDTYYQAALAALESLAETAAGIDRATRDDRRAQWERAYRNTPHGRPVLLAAGDPPAPGD